MLHSISGGMSHNTFNKNHDNYQNSAFAVHEDFSVTADTQNSYIKYQELGEMLDSSRDSLKLNAMKRIITMVAKGKNTSCLFTAVVKNVVSKNVEIKKLVYSYLERYAEEKEDLVLLSISTFQRALKEPNQLIRMSALRVLSGIRVKVIAPVVMIAIKDAVVDMSPFVRKTAAHAIPKLFYLDSATKNELVIIIEKLLSDKTVLVVGSAVMAFTRVCPEKIELIHRVYRKLCLSLSDVDEWGQVIILNMLTKYARTQFTNPSESPPILPPDHWLLLNSARPLLQSRNSAVVMAVAQMYHNIGTSIEIKAAIKALIRLMRCKPEVQEIVLDTLVPMTNHLKTYFGLYLRSFFVRMSDTIRVKLMKLEVLSNLADTTNIYVILKEMQTYILSSNDKFVAASIQAIGKCAIYIPEVANTCLLGLVSLLSSKQEIIVGESIVVIKRLLQTQITEPKYIINRMTRLLPNIEVAQARAAIFWLLGEHCRDQKVTLNALKLGAKLFSSEDDTVKAQILNLAIKIHIHSGGEYEALCQHIFNLARYDQNYDIRDRVRLLRAFTNNPNNIIVAAGASIFLAEKPAPVYEIKEEHECFLFGTTSHFIKARANGYEPLPNWAETPTPSKLRDIQIQDGSDEESFVASDYETTSSTSSSDYTHASISSSSTSSSESSEEFEENDFSDVACSLEVLNETTCKVTNSIGFDKKINLNIGESIDEDAEENNGSVHIDMENLNTSPSNSSIGVQEKNDSVSINLAILDCSELLS